MDCESCPVHECKTCKRALRDLPATWDRHLRNTYGTSLTQYEPLLGVRAASMPSVAWLRAC